MTRPTNPFGGLAGARALVTGASSGLGRHFAKLLASYGAQVFAAARRLDRLNSVVREIEESGGRAKAVELDVSNNESISAAFAAISPIDIVINNAGTADTKGVFDWSPEDWDKIVDTNLRGAWLVAQAAAADMALRDSRGSIVNVASILGERPGKGVLPYAVSKAGLLHMTRTLGLELARHGIRVNAIAPGYIETELNSGFLDSAAGSELLKRIPQRRFGKPTDLDALLLLFASDASAFMTGSTVVADGGHSLSAL